MIIMSHSFSNFVPQSDLHLEFQRCLRIYRNNSDTGRNNERSCLIVSGKSISGFPIIANLSVLKISHPNGSLKKKICFLLFCDSLFILLCRHCSSSVQWWNRYSIVGKRVVPHTWSLSIGHQRLVRRVGACISSHWLLRRQIVTLSPSRGLLKNTQRVWRFLRSASVCLGLIFRWEILLITFITQVLRRALSTKWLHSEV